MSESNAQPSPSGTKTAAPNKAKKKKPFFQKQANMLRVVYCLIAVAMTAVYFFGWRVLAVLAVCLIAGVGTEYITTRQRGKPVSMAALVTCMLFGLSLPPTVPYLVAAVGAVVAILFGKEVFGGFGRNWVNPALLGRAFVYVSFPVDLTGRFVPAFKGFPGGFAHWSWLSLNKLPDYLADTGKSVTDAVSQASPLWVVREYGVGSASAESVSWWHLLTGYMGGTFTMPDGTERVLSAGSMGEGCAIVILLAAIYLLWTKTANWRLMIPAAVGLIFANVLWRHVFGFQGVGGVPPLWVNLFGGTTIYVLVFMVTDPVSAPKKPPAQIAYGLIIGFLIVTLRWRGVFVAAATFSVLLGNLMGPLLDLGAARWEDYKKQKAKAAPEAA
jgi:Na+-transporting NADH:ubiquinone oxidoreductase subunit B